MIERICAGESFFSDIMSINFSLMAAQDFLAREAARASKKILRSMKPLASPACEFSRPIHAHVSTKACRDSCPRQRCIRFGERLSLTQTKIIALRRRLLIWFSLRGGRTTTSAWINGIVEMLDGIELVVDTLLTGRVLMLVQCVAALHILGKLYGDCGKSRDPGGLQHHQGDRLPPHRRKVLE